VTEVVLADCHVEGQRTGPWSVRVTHLPTGVVGHVTAEDFQTGRDEAIEQITSTLRHRESV
jgi:protein subunit release factor A